MSSSTNKSSFEAYETTEIRKNPKNHEKSLEKSFSCKSKISSNTFRKLSSLLSSISILTSQWVKVRVRVRVKFFSFAAYSYKANNSSFVTP